MIRITAMLLAKLDRGDGLSVEDLRSIQRAIEELFAAEGWSLPMIPTLGAVRTQRLQ